MSFINGWAHHVSLHREDAHVILQVRGVGGGGGGGGGGAPTGMESTPVSMLQGNSIGWLLHVPISPSLLSSVMKSTIKCFPC